MGRLRNRRHRVQNQRRRRRRRNPYWHNSTINKPANCRESNGSLEVHPTSKSAEKAPVRDDANISSTSNTSNQSSDYQSCDDIASPAKRLRIDDDAPDTSSSSTASTWLDFSTELCLVKIPSVISVQGVWRWCRCIWRQSFEFFKDSIFPYRVYQRELQLTTEKVQQLEQELQMLKDSTGTLNVTANQLMTTPSFECNCPCKSVSPSFLPQLCSTAQSITIDGATKPAFSFNSPPPFPPPAAPPPPPAAPPPPPPPPPPPAPIMNPVQFKSKTKKAPVKADKESSNQAAISLTDIKNVKLKKVNRKAEQTKQRKNSVPMVSLSDLKGVKLRRAKSANDENSVDIQTRLSEEAMLLRRTLKKVSMVRSPGGTPMKRKKAMDNGTGLTPLMTRALRNKFKSIRTPSPGTQPVGKSMSPKKPLSDNNSLEKNHLFGGSQVI